MGLFASFDAGTLKTNRISSPREAAVSLRKILPIFQSRAQIMGYWNFHRINPAVTGS